MLTSHGIHICGCVKLNAKRETTAEYGRKSSGARLSSCSAQIPQSHTITCPCHPHAAWTVTCSFHRGLETCRPSWHCRGFLPPPSDPRPRRKLRALRISCLHCRCYQRHARLSFRQHWTSTRFRYPIASPPAFSFRMRIADSYHRSFPLSFFQRNSWTRSSFQPNSSQLSFFQLNPYRPSSYRMIFFHRNS